MKTIDELKEEETEARNRLSIVKQEIRDYWLDRHKKDHGVFIGAIVVLKDGKKAVVSSVRAEDAHSRKPWVTGRVEKKDGDFGKAERNLYYEWTLLNT